MSVVIVDKEQRTYEGSANDGFLIKVFYTRNLADKNGDKEAVAKIMDSMFSPNWKKIIEAIPEKELNEKVKVYQSFRKSL